MGFLLLVKIQSSIVLGPSDIAPQRANNDAFSVL
jgi:hypothetical protein